MPWNPEGDYWASVKAKFKPQPDPFRPQREGPPLLDDDHPASVLCPFPKPSQEHVLAMLKKLGVDDPQAYLEMTTEERRQRQTDRLERWMRGEELG